MEHLNKKHEQISKMQDLLEFGVIFQKFAVKAVINFRILFIENSLPLFAPVTREGGGQQYW
jgi:hypothetical protein